MLRTSIGRGGRWGAGVCEDGRGGGRAQHPQRAPQRQGPGHQHQTRRTEPSLPAQVGKTCK